MLNYRRIAYAPLETKSSTFSTQRVNAPTSSLDEKSVDVKLPTPKIVSDVQLLLDSDKKRSHEITVLKIKIESLEKNYEQCTQLIEKLTKKLEETQEKATTPRPVSRQRSTRSKRGKLNVTIASTNKSSTDDVAKAPVTATGAATAKAAAKPAKH